MTDSTVVYAPGWPGISPRWTSSAKTGIGTPLNGKSKIWFALSHGIVNEVYYPRVDEACIRDFGLIVTDARSFFSEEKRHTHQEVRYSAKGLPSFHVTNVCSEGRYRIDKEIIADPERPVLLQRVRFTALEGAASGYHLFLLVASHLANHGANNTAWVADHGGKPMLFAERADRALAVACSVGLPSRSVGFVGVSDGWQVLSQHKRLIDCCDRAENGNVALSAEVNLLEAQEFVLALGLGTGAQEAAEHAVQSLAGGFDTAREAYEQEWRRWHASLNHITSGPSKSREMNSTSAMVIRCCESKEHEGGIVASLSIPWGFDKGDGDLGGYHLVWPRDLVEAVGGFLAVGAADDARRALTYLVKTQNTDGHWPQNMWIDGTPYWSGVQLDETAFPILLIGLMRREGLLNAGDLTDLWPMVRSAARFLVVNGPVTMQDRWEEDPGYSPFTLAVAIAALVEAADLAQLNDEGTVADFIRETADAWNEAIERWTYVVDSDLAREVGVDGYYVRIAPPEIAGASSPLTGFVPIKNRPPGENLEPAGHIVSPDALALVRFGLRSADDPRIVNTVKVIDALLKVDLPGGPAWHRYNDDGYGEHEDGSPFDGTGIGRAWPLLTGERAHYELAAGRLDVAEKLLHAMSSFANESSLIPEQVWDSADIPERELLFGRPSGSAMPLVWAHAEYLKLHRSIQERAVYDLPALTPLRYIENRSVSPHHIWRFSQKCRSFPRNKKLRIEVMSPSVVRWSDDNWQTVNDMRTRDTGLGMYVADLPTSDLSPDRSVVFTFYWPDADRWEGANFIVSVE